ncbi:hypothetical protein ADUPG1_011513 [Aduncisulcus paluster]|uniref:U-box domain-containing protein n=1 Tax=Aduncisulcus paluster TaxID=2918883 RepID=A0ABQ5JW11_9EUKA|nr:hypothetical protein ADUPG1_011513 [Aduncisulcus paluster]
MYKSIYETQAKKKYETAIGRSKNVIIGLGLMKDFESAFPEPYVGETVYNFCERVDTILKLFEKDRIQHFSITLMNCIKYKPEFTDSVAKYLLKLCAKFNGRHDVWFSTSGKKNQVELFSLIVSDFVTHSCLPPFLISLISNASVTPIDSKSQLDCILHPIFSHPNVNPFLIKDIFLKCKDKALLSYGRLNGQLLYLLGSSGDLPSIGWKQCRSHCFFKHFTAKDLAVPKNRSEEQALFESIVKNLQSQQVMDLFVLSSGSSITLGLNSIILCRLALYTIFSQIDGGSDPHISIIGTIPYLWRFLVLFTDSFSLLVKQKQFSKLNCSHLGFLIPEIRVLISKIQRFNFHRSDCYLGVDCCCVDPNHDPGIDCRKWDYLIDESIVLQCVSLASKDYFKYCVEALNSLSPPKMNSLEAELVPYAAQDPSQKILIFDVDESEIERIYSGSSVFFACLNFILLVSIPFVHWNYDLIKIKTARGVKDYSQSIDAYNVLIGSEELLIYFGRACASFSSIAAKINRPFFSWKFQTSSPNPTLPHSASLESAKDEDDDAIKQSSSTLSPLFTLSLASSSIYDNLHCYLHGYRLSALTDIIEKYKLAGAYVSLISLVLGNRRYIADRRHGSNVTTIAGTFFAKNSLEEDAELSKISHRTIKSHPGLVVGRYVFVPKLRDSCFDGRTGKKGKIPSFVQSVIESFFVPWSMTDGAAEAIKSACKLVQSFADESSSTVSGFNLGDIMKSVFSIQSTSSITIGFGNIMSVMTNLLKETLDLEEKIENIKRSIPGFSLEMDHKVVTEIKQTATNLNMSLWISYRTLVMFISYADDKAVETCGGTICDWFPYFSQFESQYGQHVRKWIQGGRLRIPTVQYAELMEVCEWRMKLHRNIIRLCEDRFTESPSFIGRFSLTDEFIGFLQQCSIDSYDGNRIEGSGAPREEEMYPKLISLLEEEFDMEPPDEFCCEIECGLMNDPVKTSEGLVIDMQAYQRMYSTGTSAYRAKGGVTFERLPELKRKISEWKLKHRVIKR